MINKELFAIARSHLDHLVKQSFIPIQPNDPALVTSGGTGAPVAGPPPDPAGGQVPAELMAAMAGGGGGQQPAGQPTAAAPQDGGGQQNPGGDQRISMTIDQLTRFVAAVTGKGLPEDKHTIKQLESELKELRNQLGQQPGGQPMVGGGPQPQADPNQMGTMAELKAAAVSKVDDTLALEPSVRSIGSVTRLNVEATFNLTAGRAPARAVDAVSALIRDRLGNPIALFFERKDGTIRMLTAADPEFADGLMLIGVTGPAVKRFRLNDVDERSPQIVTVS